MVAARTPNTILSPARGAPRTAEATQVEAARRRTGTPSCVPNSSRRSSPTSALAIACCCRRRCWWPKRSRKWPAAQRSRSRSYAGDLAQRFGADRTCPLMTGIFVKIIAGAVAEDLAQGRKPRWPVWRLVNDNGTLSTTWPLDAPVSCDPPARRRRPPRPQGRRVAGTEPRERAGVVRCACMTSPLTSARRASERRPRLRHGLRRCRMRECASLICCRRRRPGRRVARRTRCAGAPRSRRSSSMTRSARGCSRRSANCPSTRCRVTSRPFSIAAPTRSPRGSGRAAR